MSTQNAENTLDRVYSVVEERCEKDTPVVFMLVGILLERSISLAYYYLETNPLVLSLGYTNWSFLTIGCVITILFLWYYAGGNTRRVDKILLYTIGVIHLLAAVSNAYVVLFF